MLVQEEHSGAQEAVRWNSRLRLDERLYNFIGFSRVHSQAAGCFLQFTSLQVPNTDPKRQAIPRVFAYSPSPAKTAGMVFIKIMKSRNRFHFSMYARSSVMQMSNEGLARAK